MAELKKKHTKKTKKKQKNYKKQKKKSTLLHYKSHIQVALVLPLYQMTFSQLMFSQCLKLQKITLGNIYYFFFIVFS